MRAGASEPMLAGMGRLERAIVGVLAGIGALTVFYLVMVRYPDEIGDAVMAVLGVLVVPFVALLGIAFYAMLALPVLALVAVPFVWLRSRRARH